MDVGADRTPASPSRARPAAGAASSRGTGRKASDIKSEFSEVQGTGSICKKCEKMLKNKQQNGTLMATHLYSCCACPLAVRIKAWNACSTLQRTRPRPMDPRASRLTSEGNASGSARAPGSRPSGPATAEASSNAPSASVLYFFDRVTREQAGAIHKAVLRFFIACGVPFLAAESAALMEMLKALRPGYVARKMVPSRRQLAGPLHDELYRDRLQYVMQSLSLWCERPKAVLVLDAWENVRHNHVVNLLALVNDKAIFLTRSTAATRTRALRTKLSSCRRSSTSTGGCRTSTPSPMTTQPPVWKCGGSWRSETLD